MLPYLIFAVLIIVFYLKKQSALMVLTMLLFTIFRYDVGWDYMVYYSFIEDDFSLSKAKMMYGALWGLIFDLAAYLNCPSLIINLPGILTLVILYYSLNVICPKYGSEVSDALFVYAFWPFFFLASLSTIRQGLAVSCGLLTLALLIKKKTLWAVFILVINFFIHPTSICTIIFFFISSAKTLNLIKTIALSIAAITTIFFIPFVVEHFGLTQYLSYLEWDDPYGGKLIFLLLFISLYLLVVYFFIRSRFQNNIMASIVLITFVFEMAIIIFDLSSVYLRIGYYFDIFLTCILHQSLSLFKQRQILTRIVNSLIVCVFFYYLISTDGSFEAGLASSDYLPYHFIFNK